MSKEDKSGIILQTVPRSNVGYFYAKMKWIGIDKVKKTPGVFLTFPLAVRLLTIFSIPSKTRVDEESVAGSMAWFPVVGFIIGLLLAGLWLLLGVRFPPFLTSLVVVSFLAIITRGLHLDGLSDTIDGLGGGYTRERRLEIMKDSHVGAFGVIAIVFAILFKTFAIYGLPERTRMEALILFPVLSRFAMVLVAWKSRYARREGGLGRNYVEYLDGKTLVFALVSTIAIAGFLLFPTGFIVLVIVIAASLGMSAFFRITLGGVTGDVLGAVNELSEILGLLLLVLMT